MKSTGIRSEIARVIKVQAASLLTLGRSVDSSYVDAVKAIFECRGKIIVTGVGKSGVVAQKTAATLSSTGTTAIFLHPVEALHGDLGVVHAADIVLAIGKSGESEELLNILPAIRQLGAKVISITANKNSSLARQSSIVLFTPMKREVCPLNLAPTTSTTLAMVVGDAIAVSLMRLRRFKPEEFALYHPGGLLGKRLLFRVSDIMRSGSSNPVVSDKASLHRVLVEITRKWTGAASVIDKNRKLVGLVTDYDLRTLLVNPAKLRSASVREVMNPNPTSVYDDEMAAKALEIMEKRRKPLSVLPVVDRKGRAVGMIHIHDLITRGLVQANGGRRR